MITKIGIVGSGISGLSSYYYLRNGINITSNANKHVKINIFEKSKLVGGNIQTNIFKSGSSTNDDTNIIVEEGPRSLRAAGRGLNTLELIKRLGISNEILFSSKNSAGKFLLLDGKIQEIPLSSLPKILLFSIKHGLFKAILKEPFKRIPKPVKERDTTWDESIYDFFSRRLGKKVTERFVEPMCLGIHGGDYKKLSIKSCFPGISKIEPFGGLLLGSLFTSKKQISDEKLKLEKQLIPAKSTLTDLFDKDTDKTGVFSFRENGLSKMIQTMKQLIENDHNARLSTSTEIKEIQKNKDGSLKVTDSNGQQYEFDKLITTVPFNQLGKMFEKSDPTLSTLLKSVDYTSIAVLNFIYKSNTQVNQSIKDKGFGYLISSRENDSVIGICFDSNTFPEFVNDKSHSVVTIMIGGNKGIKERNDKWVNVVDSSDKELHEIAFKHLEKHLSITSKPDFINCKVYENGIPHYQIGHQEIVNQIQSHILKNYNNNLLIGGNSIDGVGINDSIFKSKQLIQSIKL